MFLILSLGLMLMAGWTPEVSAQSNYGRTIVAPATTDAALAKAIEDIQRCLSQMTDQKWEVKNAESLKQGVMVLPADDKRVPADYRQKLNASATPAADGKEASAGPEIYGLFSDDQQTLWIISNDTAGLSHGVYAWLDMLGCKWYFPTANWEIIPKRKDVSMKLDGITRPAFITRSFFGTGGFGPRTPIDPKLEMRDIWQRWQQRNRFGTQLSSYGHVGHAFVMRHMDEFKAHPEFAALVDGKRVEPKAGIKFCVSNKEVMNLFIQDRLVEMRKRVAENPDALSSKFVGVGPADGGGYCECENCKIIGDGSVTDQAFHTANEVAKAVAKEFPGRGVSMYAYDAYAGIPTFKLESNIQIWFIPYAFQRTGMTGDQLLDAWHAKLKADGAGYDQYHGLYTYWAITDWGRNMPGFDFTTTPQEMIPYWYNKGIGAIQFESSYASGSNALGLFMASRLMWDVKHDTAPDIEAFFADCFGPARQPMERLILRLAKNKLLHEQVIAQSWLDLKEAWDASAKDPAVRSRIEDYIAWMQYIRLWQEFGQSGLEKEQRVEKARGLLDHIWAIYPTTMVQTYRLNQLIKARHGLGDDLKDNYDTKQQDKPDWTAIKLPDSEQYHLWLEQGLKDYPLLDFEPRAFTGELKPIGKIHGDSESPWVPAGRPVWTLGSVTVHVWIPQGKKTLDLRVVAENRGSGKIVLTSYGPDGSTLGHVTAVHGQQDEAAVVSVPVIAGLNRIELFNQKVGMRFQLPADLHAVFAPFDPQGVSPVVYFYVPRGLKKLAMYNTPIASWPATIGRPDGTSFKLQQTGPLAFVDIPQGMDGKVWSITRNSASAPVILLNAPTYFAGSANTMLIPEDAR